MIFTLINKNMTFASVVASGKYVKIWVQVFLRDEEVRRPSDPKVTPVARKANCMVHPLLCFPMYFPAPFLW
jgi:hypothetical protein